MIRPNALFFAPFLAAALTACGGPMDGASASGPLAVGSGGARITSPSGLARLDIPKDALQAEVEIQLLETFDDKGRHLVEIQPDDLKLAKPAKLTFRMPEGVQAEQEHAVEVEVQNEVEIEHEVEHQICDAAENEIEAQVDHGGRLRREDRPL